MSSEYLLTQSPAELERLRLQSLVWEPHADALFDAIPVAAGWNCIDVGCGALGVLRSLSSRVGPAGSVLGVDVDEKLLGSAAAFGLPNVTVRRADVFADELPAGGFDLVHMRFMLAPIGREAELLPAALRLVRPGGVIVLQEPDAASWSLLPSGLAFDRLKSLILRAFAAGGGDFNAGRRLFSMLGGAGVRDLHVRAAVEALPPGHPYARVAIQFAGSLRSRLVQLVTEGELDAVVAEAEEELKRPDAASLTFTVVQAWGRV